LKLQFSFVLLNYNCAGTLWKRKFNIMKPAEVFYGIGGCVTHLCFQKKWRLIKEQ